MLSGRVTLIEDKTTDPLFMKAGSSYYFYQNDHLGTPQKMTAVNGAVVWSAKYYSFLEADVDSSSTMENNLRAPGQYFDSESGLHYNYHRYYDPSIGRYLKKDPIGFGGGINLFTYVFNNPVNSVDYYGLFALIKYCRNLNTITAQDSDGNYAWVRGYDSGPGPAGNEYSRNYQIPPDTYKVTRRTVGDSHDGRPTLSNTDRWDRVKSPTDPRGYREHIQLHYGENSTWSKGCIVSPEMDKIRKVIDDEYDRGGVTMIIDDHCCPENDE